jgi:hypothetical protein
MPNFADPRAPIDYGYDFNFFKKITMATGASYNTDCDITINMKAPTYTVTFFLEGGGPIFYSFNGLTDHGDMTLGQASASLTFQNRVISKIWFRGNGVIRVEAWAIR